jgi:MFS family permease
MTLKVLSKDGFYGWINVAVVFLFYIAISLLMVSFGVFLKYWKFGWSVGGASGAQQVGMILSGLAGPLVGWFIMKRGSKCALIIGNILSVIGLVLLSYMNRMWELYLGQGLLIGLGMSIGGMLAVMTVINNWFIMKRSVALAVSMAGMGLANIFMTPGLTKMISLLEWRNTYLIIAAVVALFGVIIPGIFLRNRPEDLGQVPDGPKSAKSVAASHEEHPYKNIYKTPVEFTAPEAMRTRTLWLLVAYIVLLFMAMNTLITHQFKFLCEMGLEDATAGWAVGFLSAVMMASQLGIGFLGLRFKMHSLAVVSVASAIVGFAVLLTAERFPEFLPLVFIYCFFLGVGFGIAAIALGNLFPDYFGRTEFPKIMGYTMPITTLLSSFGATIPGYIRDSTGNYTLAFQLCLALMVLAFFCIIFAKPPMHPSLAKNLNPEAAGTGAPSAATIQNPGSTIQN